MPRLNSRVESQRARCCFWAEHVPVVCRAESLFAAYYFFTRKGYEVTLASVKGGKLPIDPKSVQSPFLSTIGKKGLTDGTVCYHPACDTVSYDAY